MLGWTMAAALALATTAQDTPPLLEPATPAAVMAVPQELKDQIQARVVAPGGGREEKLQRLADLVFADDGLHLQYDFRTTRTVAEVFRDRQANCLSFTLLFVAMAREAGLEAQVQEVGEVLAWYEDEGVVYSANHVNVGVATGMQWQVVDVDSNIIAARNRPRGISDIRAMAHFHNNRGAELLAAGDLAPAQASLQRALAEAPDFVPAWNNLGVLLLRRGDMPGAERALLSALRINDRHAPTLTNLVHLYRRTGDSRLQQRYEWRLDKVERSDPFHQFMLALECEHRGDYDCAITRYQHAIRLQGDQHQFHFGLARAYFLSGDLGRAQHELGRALTLAGTEQVRDVYRQKLDGLRRWRERQATSQARL